MTRPGLKQPEIEQINAFLDGELPAEQVRQVARRISAEPAWARAARRLRKLDTMLDAWQVDPLRRDLSGAIMGGTRPQARRPAWLHVAGPLAVAAAIFAAVVVYHAIGSLIHPAGGAANELAHESPAMHVPAPVSFQPASPPASLPGEPAVAPSGRTMTDQGKAPGAADVVVTSFRSFRRNGFSGLRLPTVLDSYDYPPPSSKAGRVRPTPYFNSVPSQQ